MSRPSVEWTVAGVATINNRRKKDIMFKKGERESDGLVMDRLCNLVKGFISSSLNCRQNA